MITKSDFGWAPSQTPLGELTLTALPRPINWILWVLFLRGKKGKGGMGPREERGREGDGRGGKDPRIPPPPGKISLLRHY